MFSHVHKSSIRGSKSAYRFSHEKTPNDSRNNMNTIKIKEDTAFFGVMMTKFTPKESNFAYILIDRETKLKAELKGLKDEIPPGSPIYGRGQEDQSDKDIDILIDTQKETHRLIGISADYIQQKSELNPAENFCDFAISDGKPIYGFEDFDGLNFKKLRESFNLFRVIRTELNGENIKKIGEGWVPKYIFGEAINMVFEEYKVNLKYFTILDY